MKKVNVLVVRHLELMLFLVLWIIIASSCKKEREITLEEIQAEYSLIGNYHQMGLNFILENLKDNCQYNDVNCDINKLSKTVLISSAQFTIQKLGLSNDSEPSILKLEESINMDFVKSDLDASLIDLIANQIPLTGNQIIYLSKLDLIISNISSNIDLCINSIKNLEYQIYNNCSKEEIPLLFTATSIGANSIVYWYNNYDIWESNIALPELVEKKGTMQKEWFWSALNRMGKADIAGGLVGGCIGALAGGIGAIPGALSGACTASGNCGLVVLYEHLTQ
jgi:hypothetical protein